VVDWWPLPRVAAPACKRGGQSACMQTGRAISLHARGRAISMHASGEGDQPACKREGRSACMQAHLLVSAPRAIDLHEQLVLDADGTFLFPLAALGED